MTVMIQRHTAAAPKSTFYINDAHPGLDHSATFQSQNATNGVALFIWSQSRIKSHFHDKIYSAGDFDEFQMTAAQG